jgi:hypothetical protein
MGLGFVPRECDRPIDSQDPVGAEARRLSNLERLFHDVKTFTRRWKTIHELEALARPDAPEETAPEETAPVTPPIGQSFKKVSMDIEYHSDRTTRQWEMNRKWERVTAVDSTHT